MPDPTPIPTPPKSNGSVCIYRDRTVALEGNVMLSAVFALIEDHCQSRLWKGPHSQIAEELGISVRTAHRATKRLREIGWLTAERASTWDSTPVWTIPHEVTP